jgi:hypothetical protein
MKNLKTNNIPIEKNIAADRLITGYVSSDQLL